jgi:hypothetical protein
MALAAGCMAESGRSASEIEAVVPSPHRMLACRNEGIDGAPGRSCAFIVTGSQRRIASGIAASLRDRGYKVACIASNQTPVGLEVVGYKAGMRVTADLIPAGVAAIIDGDAVFYAPGTPTIGATVAIPSGSVGLSLDASEYATTLAPGSTCDTAGT